MSDYVVPRLLLAGKARWHVARGLRADDPRAAIPESLTVLRALDPRAAYEPIKHYAERSEGSLHVAHLLRGYQTLWAQRFALRHADKLTSGHGITEEYSIVQSAFGFTHGSVDSKAQGWEAMYQGLRKNAETQLTLTDKLGPNFSELRKRLDMAEKWIVHRVGQSKPVVLSKEKRAELVNLVVRHADAKARGLDAKAEAAWCVDLHNPSYSHSPIGQLWVADDGTFGFGWLPDRAWGRSESICICLANLAPR
ncbi:MAG: hypothetical protein FJ303_16155 [Planctomycetes bacterium]|nr:hypothetical protein [Planctomycetota bacterium]